MPELPEVETTVRAIRPTITQKKISEVVVRQRSLRYPITRNIKNILAGQEVLEVSRRAKYILISFGTGYLMIHLGMSGSLQLVNAAEPVLKHDHFDLVFDDVTLRYNDPRRFGCILWTKELTNNKLLSKLGIEPLSEEFNGSYLYKITRDRNQPIKQFIMDAVNLVGVGNIYASEALWKCNIAPTKPAKECSNKQCQILARAIKKILNKSILAGGTTIRDFKGADGKLGYFVQELQVYGKEGEACPNCESIIKRIVIGQRSSFYCPQCQK